MTRDEFRALYIDCLTEAVTKYPADYPWYDGPTIIQGNTRTTTLPQSTIEQTADRMLSAMQRGTYNKDSRAIKSMCKRLGIKHTYAALKPIIEEALGD